MNVIEARSIFKESLDAMAVEYPSACSSDDDKIISNNIFSSSLTSASSSLIELDTNSDDSLDMSGEERMFEEEIENSGCQAIAGLLAEEGIMDLTDVSMPLRYFRAEKGDIDAAVAKIKATLQWRKEFGVDKIRTCFDQGGDEEMREIVSHENATGKVYVRGYDRMGHAVVYIRPAKENSTNELNKMRHLVYQLERAIACTAKSEMEKIVFVMDFGEFKLRNAPPLSTIKCTLDILQNHYPERLHRAYVCNPPLMFRSFWNLVKNLVDPATKKKVVICRGKVGERKAAADFDLTTTEKCVYGKKELKPFNSSDYLSTPIHVTYDEPDDNFVAL